MHESTLYICVDNRLMKIHSVSPPYTRRTSWYKQRLQSLRVCTSFPLT